MRTLLLLAVLPVLAQGDPLFTSASVTFDGCLPGSGDQAVFGTAHASVSAQCDFPNGRPSNFGSASSTVAVGELTAHTSILNETEGGTSITSEAQYSDQAKVEALFAVFLFELSGSLVQDNGGRSKAILTISTDEGQTSTTIYRMGHFINFDEIYTSTPISVPKEHFKYTVNLQELTYGHLEGQGSIDVTAQLLGIEGVSGVPEPSSLLLTGTALLACLLYSLCARMVSTYRAAFSLAPPQG